MLKKNNVQATLHNNVQTTLQNNVQTTLHNNVKTSLQRNVQTTLQNNVETTLHNNVQTTLHNNTGTALPSNIITSQNKVYLSKEEKLTSQNRCPVVVTTRNVYIQQEFNSVSSVVKEHYEKVAREFPNGHSDQNTTIIHENQKVDASPQGIAVDKHSVPTKHSPSTVGIHNAPLTTSCEVKGEPNSTNTFTITSGVDQTITSSTLSNSPVYQNNEQTFTVSLLGGEQNPRYLLKKFLNSKRTTTSLPPESLVSDETPFSNTVESSVPSCSNCVEKVVHLVLLNLLFLLQLVARMYR